MWTFPALPAKIISVRTEVLEHFRGEHRWDFISDDVCVCGGGGGGGGGGPSPLLLVAKKTKMANVCLDSFF